MDTTKLQERIANVYYRHGLFCARHPVAVICLSLLVISFSCYPLIYLPIFKSAFYFKTSPFQPPSSSSSQQWEGPVVYILQVVLKSSVLPWQEDLKFQDAFRGPLAQVFSLEEAILNHQVQAKNGSTISLSNICLQVAEPLKFASILPHYGCLMVSPSLLWKNDISSFQQDEDIVRTIFHNPDPKLDSTNLKEILFGIPWKETGIKRFNMRTRSRVLTYAVTIVLKEFNIDYVQSLRQKLSGKYPHDTQSAPVYNEADLSSFLHFNNQAQDSAHLVQYLALTYLAAFLYIYFSVCKMELVEWKALTALSAVATLVLTLLMAVGLCLWFGLLPSTWQPVGLRCDLSDLLPYMVLVVGLENHFIITKSVISTPNHIDLKLRVAQGLSKEGYSITKHFAMELLLLLAAFCTFMPTVQEFCQVALVGVVSDFFLQMVFFTTLLSTNLKKIETLDPYKPPHHHYQVASLTAAEGAKQDHLYTTPVLSLSRAMISKMAYRRNGWSHYSRSSAPILVTVPKRLRFMYFWARTRMVQRFLMLCLICWIVWLLYISGFVEHLHLGIFLSVLQPLVKLRAAGHSEEANGSLAHGDPELWRQLPPQHWSSLLGLYNISLLGRSVGILPPVLLSAPVSPAAVDHPALHLTPEIDEEEGPGEELYLTLAVSVPTMCLVAYVMVVLYRCMCTRRYAEWRTSWSHRAKSTSTTIPFYDPGSYAMVAAPPITLPNHVHELDELVNCGNLAVSTCLNGDVMVWDGRSGECINLIVRTPLSDAESPKTAPDTSSNPVISGSSLYSSGVAGYDFGPFYTNNHSSSGGSNQADVSLLSLDSNLQQPVEESRVHYSSLPTQPVWCLDCQEWMCVLGCGMGRIEVWNVYRGELLCCHAENPVGITTIKLVGRRVLLARIDGSLEFFHLQEYLVTGASEHQKGCRLVRLHNLKPHNQPISCLLVHTGSLVVTGSQDHLIKVFKYETATCLFTLHGHIGGITALYIDIEQGALVSGCGGGQLCNWEVGTGTCLYSLQGHPGPVTGLHTTSMYLISHSPTLICIWEKSQGHLLHSIRKERSLCNDLILLTSNFMVTARDNQLEVWDVNHGERLRAVEMPHEQRIAHLGLCGATLVVASTSQLVLVIDSYRGTPKTD